MKVEKSERGERERGRLKGFRKEFLRTEEHVYLDEKSLLSASNNKGKMLQLRHVIIKFKNTKDREKFLVCS